MPDFSSTYYSLKRSALAFLSIVIVLSLPGVTAGGQPSFGGIVIDGLAFRLLLGLLWMAAVYYAVSFGLTWEIEGKGKLLALEQGGGDLQTMLQRAIERLQDVSGQLSSYVADHLRWTNNTEVAQLFGAVGARDLATALVNKIAGPDVRHGPSGAASMAAIEGAVEQFFGHVRSEIPQLRSTLQGLSERLDTHGEEYTRSLNRICEEISALASRLRSLQSARRFKFYWLDACPVALCTLAATILVANKLWAWF